MKELEYYLALPWDSAFNTEEDGEETYVRLTVRGLSDFAVYGDSISEVKKNWREALESHLAGYLAVGKIIPEPISVEGVLETSAEATSSMPDTEHNVLMKQQLEQVA